MTRFLNWRLAVLGVTAFIEIGSAKADLTEQYLQWASGASAAQRLAYHEAIKDSPAQGEYAISLNFSHHVEHFLAFPRYRDADWDLSNAEYIEFKVKMQPGTNFGSDNPRVYLRNKNGAFIRIRKTAGPSLLSIDKSGQWQQVRIPLHEAEGWEHLNWLHANIQHVAFFEIGFTGGGFPSGATHNVLVDDVQFGPKPVSYTPHAVDLPDLDVLWIERTPRYERYNVAYTKSAIDPRVDGIPYALKNPDAKLEPTPGEKVTFTAHIQNKGLNAAGGKYEWTLDGKTVAKGNIKPLKSREKLTFSWKWNWDSADHDLTFRIIPDAEEFCNENDAVTIRTNGLMLKFMIERGAIAQMETRVNMLGSRSCEDWLQGQLRFMNQLFAESKYPFAPDGITARVYVAKVEYVDDNHIMTLGSGPFRVGELDNTVDGGRGVMAIQDPWYVHTDTGLGAGGINEYINNIGRADDCWLHELSHQIGVIDNYQFCVDRNNNKVNGVGFGYRNGSLMGGDDITPYKNLGQLYSMYSPLDVFALNITKGYRRGYFGEYLFFIPKHNTLKIVDTDGKPITNATIKVYQQVVCEIDKTPEFTGTTDSSGKFALANRPADRVSTATGATLSDNPFGPINVVGMNGTFLIVIDDDGVEKYAFIALPEFVVAWAAGYRDKAEYEIKVQKKGDERHYFAGPNSHALKPAK